MKTVCVIRTLEDERELLIVAIPDAPPSFAVLSVPMDYPSADADVRVVAHGLADGEEAHEAAVGRRRPP